MVSDRWSLPLQAGDQGAEQLQRASGDNSAGGEHHPHRSGPPLGLLLLRVGRRRAGVRAGVCADGADAPLIRERVCRRSEGEPLVWVIEHTRTLGLILA